MSSVAAAGGGGQPDLLQGSGRRNAVESPPCDQRLAVPGAARSRPGLQAWLVRLGATTRFGEGAALLALLAGLPISPETIRQHTEGVGTPPAQQEAVAIAQSNRHARPRGRSGPHGPVGDRAGRSAARGWALASISWPPSIGGARRRHAGVQVRSRRTGIPITSTAASVAPSRTTAESIGVPGVGLRGATVSTSVSRVSNRSMWHPPMT